MQPCRYRRYTVAPSIDSSQAQARCSLGLRVRSEWYAIGPSPAVGLGVTVDPYGGAPGFSVHLHTDDGSTEGIDTYARPMAAERGGASCPW